MILSFNVQRIHNDIFEQSANVRNHVEYYLILNYTAVQQYSACNESKSPAQIRITCSIVRLIALFTSAQLSAKDFPPQNGYDLRKEKLNG